MSQNHTTTNGIPERDQIDIPALNKMGQYHGNTPEFINLERKYPYVTCHILFRVHMLLPLNKPVYAL